MALHEVHLFDAVLWPRQDNRSVAPAHVAKDGSPGDSEVLLILLLPMIEHNPEQFSPEPSPLRQLRFRLDQLQYVLVHLLEKMI